MNCCYGKRGPQVCILLGGSPFLEGSFIQRFHYKLERQIILDWRGKVIIERGLMEYSELTSDDRSIERHLHNLLLSPLLDSAELGSPAVSILAFTGVY